MSSYLTPVLLLTFNALTSIDSAKNGEMSDKIGTQDYNRYRRLKDLFLLGKLKVYSPPTFLVPSLHTLHIIMDRQTTFDVE